MMEVVYNNDSWPIVIIKMIGEAKTQYDIDKVIEVWTQIYIESMQKKQKFRLLFDVRQSSIKKIGLLKHIGSFLVKVKSMTEEWMERTSILVSDNSIKMLIKFVFTFYKPVRPFKVFTDEKESLEWLISNTPGEELKINFKKRENIYESNISFT